MGYMETGGKRVMVKEVEKLCPSCGALYSNDRGFKNIDKMIYCTRCGAKLEGVN